jgi:hypothetical protein
MANYISAFNSFGNGGKGSDIAFYEFNIIQNAGKTVNATTGIIIQNSHLMAFENQSLNQS